MGTRHLVNVGLLGAIGHYESTRFQQLPRDTRVICRTMRGLEVGTVMCHLDDSDYVQPAEQSTDGQLLRRVSSEDNLIIERLERNRDRAFLACEKLIQQQGSSALLVDVEHLFDGESVFFYFLGEVDESIDQLTEALSETYEKKVRFKKFAETLAQGCGPGCGTGASQCSTGKCSSCSLAAKCSTSAPIDRV